jgi:hypothetical protein
VVKILLNTISSEGLIIDKMAIINETLKLAFNNLITNINNFIYIYG